MALWLLLPLLPTPAAAQPVAGDWVVPAPPLEVHLPPRLDCPRPADEAEIVVCGTREEDRRYRLPLAAERTPGAAERAGGEQRAALALDTGGCTTVGRDQQCGGGLDMIGVGFAIARAIAQAVANRD